MNKVIHLLIVEDSENDAIIIQRHLKKQGYDPIWERVDNSESMRASLEKPDLDIVIADYVLPGFSGLAALKLLQEKNPDIPCIITSGRIDEETAVAAMKAGAKDYIMKDHLQRLGPAVERELQEAKIRLERRKAEEALRQNEAKLGLVLEQMPCILWTTDTSLKVTSSLGTGLTRLNLKSNQVVGMTISEYFSLSGPHNIALSAHRSALEGIPMSFEMKIQDPEKVYYSYVEPLRNSSGSIIGVIGVAMDTTERVKAEESQRKFTAIVESSSDAIISKTVDDVISSWNKGAENIYGYSETEVIGKPISLLEPGGDAENIHLTWKTAEIQEKVVNYEANHIRKDGNKILVSLTISPIQNNSGSLLGTSIIARDITEQKTLERRNLLSNQIMKLFWESSSKRDYADKVINLIQNWCKCDGIGLRIVNREDEVIPYLASRGFDDEFVKTESALSLKYDQCACIRVINGKPEPQDHPALTPGGSFHLSNSQEFADNLTREELARFRGVCIGSGFQTILIVPIAYLKTTLGAIHLTDRSKSAISLKEIETLEAIAPLLGQGIYRFDIEEKIRASEARLAKAQRIANLGNWDWNIKTDLFWWSDEIYHIFNFKPETFIPSYEMFLKLAHPDDRELVERSFRDALNNKGILDIECRILLPDGLVRIVHERGEVKCDEAGSPLHVIGTIQDITERKALERQLIESSLYARSLIEASPDPLVTISAEGKIMDVNTATEIATGLNREKLKGTDFADYFTAPEKAKESYKKVYSEGYVKDYPLSLRHVQGNITEILYNAVLYRNSRGEVQGVLATARDVTPLKRVEEELRGLSRKIVDAQENERRSIARELHDEIGQSLTALKMLLAQVERLPSNARASCLHEAKAIIGDLMQQVREMSLNLRPSMLDDLGLLPTLLWHFERFTTQTGIHIKFAHNGLPGILPPEVNTAVYRVVQEALTNIARHAKVNTADVDIRYQDDNLLVRIEDKGTGFVFSGLKVNLSAGLSGMRERVRLLGGRLILDSSPGHGTIVRVEIPVSDPR